MNVKCPHCNTFRNENEVCTCKEAVRTLYATMSLVMAEHQVMRKRLIELEEVYEDLPVRWRGSGEPIVNLSEEIHNFLKQKSEQLRHDETENNKFTGFSNN